jgi:hypothetical protein
LGQLPYFPLGNRGAVPIFPSGASFAVAAERDVAGSKKMFERQ